MGKVPVQTPVSWLFDHLQARFGPEITGEIKVAFEVHNRRYSRACELGHRRRIVQRLRGWLMATNDPDRLRKAIARHESWIARTIEEYPELKEDA